MKNLFYLHIFWQFAIMLERKNGWESNMVILGIDFGDKRMGTAICDRDETMAVSIATLFVKGAKDAARQAAAMAVERGAEKIVVGMPERSGGYRGERCEKTEFFLSFLRELVTVPVVTEDERYTTVQAHTLLYETGMAGKNHTGCVDALSAQLILQSYMDRNKK